MRKITVDFSLQKHPLFAGYVGEHNATELTAIKPDGLEGVTYSLAFMTNGKIIHSEFFGVDEEIKVTLWQQLTLDNDLYVQLEAYDENGKYLGKSGMVKLVLSNSVHGMDMIADADNPDVYAEIAQNSAFRETLEDNAELLNELTAMTTTDILKLFRDGTEPNRNSFIGGLAIKRFLQTLELYYVTKTKLDEMIENGELGGIIDSLPADKVTYTNEKLADTSGTLKGALDEAVVYVTSEMPDLIAKKHMHHNKETLDFFEPNWDDVNCFNYKGDMFTPWSYVKSAIPKKTSQLTNDSEFITAEDLPKSRATAQKDFTQDDENFSWVVEGKMFYILFPEGNVDIPVGTEIADVEFVFANSNEVPNGVYISVFDMFKYGNTPYISMTKNAYIYEGLGHVITAIYFPEGLNAVASEIDNFMWTSAHITYYTD